MRVIFDEAQQRAAQPPAIDNDDIGGVAAPTEAASMGALGTIYPNGDLELALTIRTFAVADGQLHREIEFRNFVEAFESGLLRSIWISVSFAVISTAAVDAATSAGTYAPGRGLK